METTALYTGRSFDGWVDGAVETAKRDAALLKRRGYYAVADNGTLWVRNGDADACLRIIDEAS